MTLSIDMKHGRAKGGISQHSGAFFDLWALFSLFSAIWMRIAYETDVRHRLLITMMLLAKTASRR